MKPKASEKRRSDRLMITLSLVLEGKDGKGQPFDHPARTITINRHGARILTSHPLRAGQTITVTNLSGRRKGRFRVVGPVTPATYRGGEWGIECVNLSDDVWGIQFPPAPSSRGGPPKALLECQECGTTALSPISLVEAEVLENAGIIARDCAHCERETPWGLSNEQRARAAKARGSASAEGKGPSTKGGAENRRHRRSALQLPVLIRDYYGGSETTRTENLSKGGFCFISEKRYQVGEVLLVVCPYDPSTSNHIQLRARVVRSRPGEGGMRQVYGVRYER